MFDYLCDRYAQKRAEILAQYESVSKFDSENLIHAMIKDVLRDDAFSSLGVTSHVRLGSILRDKSLLSAEERAYASNVLTHVDFLLYDQFSKEPRLAIEVDGVSYHRPRTKQAERDEMKNAILERYGIPYIRFRTDGSGERERLNEKLTALQR